MFEKFKIVMTCTLADRPPISYRVREYFVKFLTEHVFEKKKIIVDGNWTIILGIIFISDGKNAPKTIFFPKGAPRTVASEQTKLYEILIPLKPIQDAAYPYVKTIELLYEALKI